MSLSEFLIRCRAEDSENLPYEAVSPYVREQHGLCPWKPTFSIQPPSPISVPSCNEFATVRKTRRTFASLALDDDEALLSIERSAARSSASKNVLLSMRSAQKPLKSRARSITRIQILQITGSETMVVRISTWKALRRRPPIEDLNDCFDVRG